MNAEDVLNYKDPPNGFKDQVINAGIQAGFAFFTTMSGIAVAQIRTDPLSCLIAGCVSAGFAFFGSLVVQRGLQKKKE